MSRRIKSGRVGYEDRVALLAALAALPGSACALFLVWNSDWQRHTQITWTVVIVGVWILCAIALRERVVFPLQTLSNLLGALREGDYSVRGRSYRDDDALGEVMREINTLGSTLREQRLGALEATTLLRTVMREIDVAIFAFDEHRRLRLVNRGGERLLDKQQENLLGLTAEDLTHGSLPRWAAANHSASLIPRRRRTLRPAPHAASASAACRWNWWCSPT